MKRFVSNLHNLKNFLNFLQICFVNDGNNFEIVEIGSNLRNLKDCNLHLGELKKSHPSSRGFAKNLFSQNLKNLQSKF